MPISLLVALPDRIDREFRRWAKRTPGSSWPSWGGHITLLPRLSVRHLDGDTLRQRIQAVCARHEPFAVCIDEVLYDADYTRPGYQGVFLRMKPSSESASRQGGEANPDVLASGPNAVDAADIEKSEDSDTAGKQVKGAWLDDTADDNNLLEEFWQTLPGTDLLPDEIVDVILDDAEDNLPQNQVHQGELPTSGYNRLLALRNDLLSTFVESLEPTSDAAEAIQAIRRREFSPHLTLALSLSEQEAQDIVEAARAEKLEAQFTIRRISLLLFDRDGATAEAIQRVEFALGRERFLSVRGRGRNAEAKRESTGVVDPAAGSASVPAPLDETSAAPPATESTDNSAAESTEEAAGGATA